jgi:WD40 repeat protein
MRLIGPALSLLLFMASFSLPICPQEVARQGQKRSIQRRDQHGDALPDGARPRMGTIWRQHGARIHILTFLPDGASLLSWGDDGMFKRWSVPEGRELQVLAGPKTERFIFTISADGKLMAFAGEKGEVVIWDIFAEKPALAVKPRGEFVSSVVFSQEGARVASGTAAGLIQVWDVATGRELSRTQACHESVRHLAFGPTGTMIASVCDVYEKQTVRVWGLQGNVLLREFENRIPLDFIEFIPGGADLLWMTGDGTIHVADTRTGREQPEFKPASANFSLRAGLSPDGKKLVLGTEEGMVQLVDLQIKRSTLKLDTYASEIPAMSFSQDGKRLAIASGTGSIELFDVDTGKEIPKLFGHGGPVWSVAYSPDGKTLASGSSDGTVRIWDAGSGEELRKFFAGKQPILSVAFSPDGKFLASGGGDGFLKLWDVRAGVLARQTSFAETPVHSLSFSPDGNELILVSGTGLLDPVRMWNVGAWREDHVFVAAGPWVECVAYSPDDKVIAVGATDFSISIWDAHTFSELRRFQGSEGPLVALAFSPNGKLLASTNGASIRVWDVSRVKQVLSFQQGTSAFTSLAFSPNGHWLVSSGSGGTLHLWDVDTGGEIRRLRGHRGEITSLTFTPDGERVATGSLDSTILVWNLAEKDKSQIHR